MKKMQWITVLIAAAVTAGITLAPMPGRSQTPEKAPKKISATKAQNIAENFELNAGTLTVFDRQGKLLNTVGPRALYGAAAFSPDAKRVAVVKVDQENESRDIWVFDVASGAPARITTSERGEWARLPAWSPDGSQMAYIALRGGSVGFYRRSASGQGSEELLYKSPGFPDLCDWSMDGRFISFQTNQLTEGGLLSVLPLEGAGARKPLEVVRSKREVACGTLSPDSRWVAYTSNESGRNQVYVRAREAAGGSSTQISPEGGSSAMWRRDGKELYYSAPDRSVMAVAMNTSTGLPEGPPKVLFRPPQGKFNGFTVSRDGERILMQSTQPQLRQLTILDRQGKTVKKVGDPGFYFEPKISPDGRRIAAVRRDPRTGDGDIWTFDVATGKEYAVTSDYWFDFAVEWSPDSKQVAYVSNRDGYNYLYRKNWDGTGEAELLFRYTPGAGMELHDWSPDGKFISFSTGALSLVAMQSKESVLERKAIDWLRDENQNWQGRFSPDMRYMAYLSDETDVESMELYVRPFDAAKPEAPGAGAVARVSTNGARGMTSWRADGKELYFLNRAWEMVEVDVSTTPVFQAGASRVLFKLPKALPGDTDQWKGVSPGGDRFVFSMPVE